MWRAAVYASPKYDLGVQDMLPQNMPLGHTDFFELWTLEKQEMQGEA